MTTDAIIFVLAHTDELLESVPRHPLLRPVDLRTLTLPERWDTNLLAEARFLFSDEFGSATQTYVGLLSARHDEKYPQLAPLAGFADFVATKIPLPKRMAFAPALSWMRRGQPDDDQSHPGIAALLSACISPSALPTRAIRVPYGNSFFCHRSQIADLRVFVEAALSSAIDRHGPDLPFTYRCPTCGETSPDGIGRWRRDRHWGYFVERLTALHFAVNTRAVFVGMRPDELNRFRLRYTKRRWHERRTRKDAS